MNKKKAVLNLTRMLISAKITRCRNIVTMLTGNANFPTPNPALAVITAKLDALDLAYQAAEDGSKMQKALAQQLNLELDALMRTLRDYVNELAAGNEVKILSAGFEVSKDPTPPVDMTKVVGLKCFTSEFEGQADLRWTPVKGAKAYFVQKLMETPEMTDGNGVLEANESDWEIGALCTKSRTEVENLVGVRSYWFRVAAIGPKGPGPWSDPGRAVIS